MLCLLKSPESKQCFLPPHDFYLGSSHRHLSWDNPQSLLTSFSVFTPALHVQLTVALVFLLRHKSDPVTHLLKTLQWLHSPQNKSQMTYKDPQDLSPRPPPWLLSHCSLYCSSHSTFHSPYPQSTHPTLCLCSSLYWRYSFHRT